MSIEKDKLFASKICDGDKEAVSDFYELICDDIYYLASKFHEYGEKEEYWDYRTKTGYNIEVTDAVSDSALWYFKTAKQMTCNYKGIAPLINFIRSSLYRDRTKINLLRSKKKNMFDKNPAISGYIPKLIQKLSDKHVEIFKLLTYKKPREEIKIKLSINDIDYASYYIDIEKALIRSDKLHLIYPIQEISLNRYKKEDQESEPIEIASSDLEPYQVIEMSKAIKMIKSLISDLYYNEKRLLGLYWGMNQSIKQIFLDYNDPLGIYNNYREVFNIKTEKDIRSTISKIEYKLFNLAKEKFQTFIDDYNVDNKQFRQLLKNYLTNMDSEEYE